MNSFVPGEIVRSSQDAASFPSLLVGQSGLSVLAIFRVCPGCVWFCRETHAGCGELGKHWEEALSTDSLI